jgi:uncharacterized protein YdaU (DUF1376 family)
MSNLHRGARAAKPEAQKQAPGGAPFLRFFPKDYLSSESVAFLSLEEEGAYLRALLHCWINNGIPSDPGRLARLIGKGCTPETAAAVLELMEPIDGDAERATSPRIEVERAHMNSERDRRALGAAITNAKKKQRGADIRQDEPTKTSRKQGKTDGTHSARSAHAERPLSVGGERTLSGRYSETETETETEEEKTSCAEPAKPASAPAAVVPFPPAVLTFPTSGGGPGGWDLTEAKVEEYRGSFPAVDVLAEVRKAWQWIQDNPTKKKTAGGMPRFLSSWLGRAQDRGGIQGAKVQYRGRETSAESLAKLADQLFDNPEGGKCEPMLRLS